MRELSSQIPLLHSKPLDPKDEKPFIESLNHLESFLESSGHFVCGPNLTLADISIVASLSFAEAADYDSSDYKFITSWKEKVKSLVKDYSEINDEPVKRFREYLKSKKVG